jgi:hypothetical protein
MTSLLQTDCDDSGTKVKSMSVETIGVPGLTAHIVSAHISHNDVAPQSLPALIREVYRSLSATGEPHAGPAAPASTPAVPIHKSVFPDILVCLESERFHPDCTGGKRSNLLFDRVIHALLAFRPG